MIQSNYTNEFIDWAWDHPVSIISYVTGSILSPLVSLVALPIFCSMASYHFVKYSYYNWANRSIETYGRIKGQNYTRWNGKSVIINKELSRIEQLHAAIGEHLHGKDCTSFISILRENIPPKDYPFKTIEDLNWLNREFCKRDAKDWLISDLKMLRAFSKALIPFIGLYWVLQTEVMEFGGASFIGCTVCALGDSEYKHWGWEQALDFHRKLLSIALHLSKPETTDRIMLGGTYFLV